MEFLVELGVVEREEIVVVEAEDLLERPAEVLRQYCGRVGVEFREGMLKWGEAGEKEKGFEKWKGFHEDAIRSTGLEGKPKVSFPSLLGVRWWRGIC